MSNHENDKIRQAMFAEARSGELIKRAVEFARAYSSGIFDQRVFPDEVALAALSAFDEPLPEMPGNGRETIDKLNALGSPATVAQTGGRYFGMVNGGVVPTGLAARLLADAWDQNAVLYATSPVNAKLETVVENWLKDLLGLPGETVAGLVSGTSLGTVSGLAAGRYHLLKRAGWDVNSQGLNGAPALRVIAGRHVHGTAVKALVLLGMGTDCIEWVEVDEQGRMRLDSLPPLDERCIVLTQAGNVNSGAFDPIRAVCERAREAGAWVHVDGAFGLWAAACERLRHFTDGIELAHSLSLDAHKTLNGPYDCGIVLCREPEALVSALQNSGAYIAYTEHRDGMLYTPEMSRRARAVELWATLRYLGRQGVDQLVWGLHRRASQFAEELAQAGFEVLNEVVFNQVVVAAGDDETTRRTMENIQRSGQAWAGGSQWHGRQVIRVSVCSWVTTADDVSRSVAAFAAARERARQHS